MAARRILPKSAQKVVNAKRASGAITASPFFFARHTIHFPVSQGVSTYAKSGSADTNDFHARSIAGGIFFAGHGVYFAFIINWYAASQDDPETVRQFFSAIHKPLTRLKNSLSSDCGYEVR